MIRSGTKDSKQQGRTGKGGDPGGLKREMGLWSATFLVVASMIGTGIFTTSGFIMEALHDPRALLLSWVIGGLFALSGALCYGELGAMFPKAGGDYVFLREGFGRVVGFLSGWISLIVGFSAPLAAAAMASAAYLFRALAGSFFTAPHRALWQAGGLSVSPDTVLAVSIIILFTVIHSYSLRFGSVVQNVLTLLKVVVIMIFVAAGLMSGHGAVGHFSPMTGAKSLCSGGFATSLIFVSFAYSGWNAAAYLGGEIREPGRNIPLALILGTLSVTVLYLLLNMVYIYALDARAMEGVIEIGAASAISLFGGRAGRIFSLAVMVCILSVVSAMIMSGPRVYFAMARDGSFFPGVGRVTGAHGTPGPSILLQSGIAGVMVLTSTFDKLLLYAGFTLSLFAMLTVAGMMVLRTRRPSIDRPYRTLGYPVTPILFIAGNFWVAAFFVAGNPLISLFGAGTILSGIPAYYCFHRRYLSACTAQAGGRRGREIGGGQ